MSRPAPEPEAALEGLAADTTSGAAELYAGTLELALSLEPGSLPDFGRALLKSRRDMAPLLNLGLALSEPEGDPRRGLLRRLSRLREAGAVIARRAVERLGRGRRSLTISRSSSVRAALTALEPETALVLRSEPGDEALTLVAELCRDGIEARLIADADLGEAVADVDFALCGADALTGGLFVNKIGTRALAEALHRAGKPLHPLCDESKLLTAELYPRLQPNPLFEEIPLRLVAGVITDGEYYYRQLHG